MVRHCSNARNERSLSRSVLSALACHLKGRVDDGVVSLMPVYERVLAQLAAFAESWISAMRVSNVVVIDFETICDSWTSFYKDLFTACPVDFEVKSDIRDLWHQVFHGKRQTANRKPQNVTRPLPCGHV